jgi:hypothetical protein
LTAPRLAPNIESLVGRVDVLVVALVLGGAVASVAAGAGKADKFPLLGPYGGAHCDGSGITAGTEGGFGSAKISGTGTVEAKVSVKGLSPNTTYYVRFIQGVADCGTTDATFETNGSGKAHVSISEPSVSTHAYVFIEDGPATQFYVTETYFHAL